MLDGRQRDTSRLLARAALLDQLANLLPRLLAALSLLATAVDAELRHGGVPWKDARTAFAAATVLEVGARLDAARERAEVDGLSGLVAALDGLAQRVDALVVRPLLLQFLAVDLLLQLHVLDVLVKKVLVET